MRHLIIFVKNPVLGKVKTRLAATVGDERALEVYHKLLAITRKVAIGVDCKRQLYYSDVVDTDDHWGSEHFAKHTQRGIDLGERMLHAFIASFAEGATKAIIIGSDCPEITPRIIDEAFEALDRFDVVVGPAEDGGYYLLGMKRAIAELFINRQWSTSTVLHEMLTDVGRLGLSVGILTTLSDLDNADDLIRHDL